jgi:penicillin-binding protein 1B
MTTRKKASKSSKKGRSASKKHITNKISSSIKRLPIFRLLLLVFFVSGLSYSLYLDHVVTGLFEGRIWQLPARVYARPLELYVGKNISAKQLNDELEGLNYTKVQQLPAEIGRYHHWSNTFEIITREFNFWDGHEKSRKIRVVIENTQVVKLQDLYSSAPIPLVRFDPAYITGIFPSHGEDRMLLKLDEVDDDFVKMLILTEDRRFFDHPGVDIFSIARAFIANIKAGRTVQGGSTITQQLVKNLYLTPTQNIWRKVREAIMALLLELHYDKQQILETYINEIYLGQDQERAIHGFGLASIHYYGKPMHELTFDEMAMLIGMVKGASYYHPTRNPDRATERRNVVISLMAGQGMITADQAVRLSEKPLRVTRHAKRDRYPAFVDLIKRQLRDTYNSDDLKSEGLQIFTTLDPFIEQATEKAVVDVMPSLDFYNQDLQTATIVVSPNNGDVLAVVGDRKPTFSGFNRALDARRHVGSLMKPVIYLSALTQPDRYTLSTVLDDTRLRIQGQDKKIWEPQNYDKEYHGNVILYEALVKSYNIPAARVGLDIGLGEIVETVRELGSSKVLPPYPSITLGAVDMSPYDVASIYQTFAANGFHSPLRSVLAVLDKNGEPLSRYALDVERQIDPAAIALVNHTMKGVAEQGTARRLANELGIKVAGKTGTSDDLRDSWFAGFSGDMVAVTWVGHDDNRPSGLTGSSGAMRIWSRVMKAVSSKSYVSTMPDNIEMQWVDRDSGLLSGKHCENAIELPFIKGSAPELKAECSGAAPSNWFQGIFGD